MLIKKKIFHWVVLCAFFASIGYIGADQGWWDKLIRRKSPMVLESSNAPAPLEVHPDVESLQDSFAKVAELVKPAVVNISAIHVTKESDNPEFYFGDPNEFFYRYFGERAPEHQRQREFRSEGTGSGVIIDPEGYILTNNHVVQEADQLTVALSNGKSFKGKVIGSDPRSDLAVIQIKAPNPLAYVPLGDSSSIRIGDWALAIGSPFGLEQTVTAGIISAIRQSLNIEGKTFANLIQTDAAINRGNSGGPLVNLKGQVIGINTAIYAPTGVFSGIGFAIPVNNAKRILKDLIEKGYVERSWMGIEIAEIDEVIAQQFGLESSKGALINKVIAGGPADKAGFLRGDVIVEFDGKKIGDVLSLQEIVSATPPKKKVEVVIIRANKKKTLSLVTAVMPNQPGETEGRPKSDSGDDSESKAHKWLGASFSQIGENVVATDVPPNSDAAEAGLMEGDEIHAINRAEIKSLADLKKVSSAVKLKDGVVFDITRDGRSFYLSYKTLQ
jgi:serine protease Do